VVGDCNCDQFSEVKVCTERDCVITAAECLLNIRQTAAHDRLNEVNSESSWDWMPNWKL